MNPLHPKKLLLTKWTAVQPVNRQKHFVVTKVIEPEVPEVPEGGAPAASQDGHEGLAGGKPRKASTTPRVDWIEIEAVHSGQVRRIPWRELRDAALWRQGWV